jgi:hypothetical protein
MMIGMLIATAGIVAATAVANGGESGQSDPDPRRLNQARSLAIGW